MCRRITCKTCGKPGWAGCGAHVEQVLGNVAVEDRCSCATDSAGDGATAKKTGGFLRRIFGG